MGFLLRPISTGLVIFMAGCGTARTVMRSDSPSLADFSEQINQGDLKTAGAGLNQRLRSHPDDVEARFLRAMTRSAQGDYEGAVLDYEKILKGDPEHAEAHYQAGTLLAFRIGNTNHALYHLKQYLKISPRGSRASSAAHLIAKLKDKVPEKEIVRESQKPFYKKPIFWILTVAVVGGGAAAAMAAAGGSSQTALVGF